MHTYRETRDDSTYSCLTLQCGKNDACSVKTILQGFELFPGRQHTSGYAQCHTQHQATAPTWSRDSRGERWFSAVCSAGKQLYLVSRTLNTIIWVGIDSSASSMLGKHPATQLYLFPFLFNF